MDREPLETRLPDGLDGIVVPAVVSEHPARLGGRGPAGPIGAEDIFATDIPTPSLDLTDTRLFDAAPSAQSPVVGGAAALAAPAFGTTFPSLAFDDNSTNGQGQVTPADPIGAAGPDHVVSVINVSIQFYTKSGTPLLDEDSMDADPPRSGISLANFFAPVTPVNATFDPKVIYDQHEGRFVVVTLERDLGAAQTSRILLAVSDDDDPTGTWFFTEIDSKFASTDRCDSNGPGPQSASWADFPGLAVDEEVVYVTANLFAFSNGDFCGTRLWIIDKDVSGGFYTGGTASVGVFNPALGNLSWEGTAQPAHVFGVPTTGLPNVGTWLVRYDGLTGSGNKFIQVVRVNDPIPFTATNFDGRFLVNMGAIEDSVVGVFPDAPQLDLPGGVANPQDIETNDRRTLHSVWRDDSLYLTTTIDPENGDPNDGQATAHWVQMDTSPNGAGSPSLADQGDIGGEDIANDVHTFYPSIAVNSGGDIAVGFSASGPTIHPSSYYTTHRVGDAPGSNTGSTLLTGGLDEYVRTFGTGRNRWGDYSGTALDPVDECFWIYNQHADTRGSTSGIPPNEEDGRWANTFGKACACEGTQALTDGAWRQISMVCNPGEMSTVADVFGDDLGGVYDTNWVVYRRDELTPSYVKLATTDSLVAGEGYWIKTNLAGQSVDMEGASNSVTDIPLVGVAAAPPAGCGTSAGQCNKVGHPHNYDVCWADVRVVDGATTHTLADADPGGACQMGGGGCIMSRIAHKWTGASYAPFDGQTPGMEGTLVPWDGFWVSANKPGIELQIPTTPGSCGAPAASLAEPPALSATSREPALRRARRDAPEGWYIRLTAASGAMVDSSNVFGQLEDSVAGYDSHDLPELDPFGNDYLTVVFPHLEWGAQAGNYATDYHGFSRGPWREAWHFEVHASDAAAEVTLSWEGPARQLRHSRLVDNETGERIRPKPGESYTFKMTGPSRSFTWHLRGGQLKSHLAEPGPSRDIERRSSREK